MKRFETGFGGLQILLVVVTIGVAALVAVPKYKAYASKAKITEALNLAGESKRKITQSYMVTSSFPRTTSEAQAMMTTTVSKPEFVREMKIEPDRSGNKVVIKVFLNEGVVENETGEEQFLFMAGNQTQGGQYAIEWRCGGSGLDPSLLPEDCRD